MAYRELTLVGSEPLRMQSSGGSTAYVSVGVSTAASVTLTPQMSSQAFTFATAAIISGRGVSARGQLPAAIAQFTSAASLEAVSTEAECGVAIYRTGAASTAGESYILMAAKDAAGTGTKTMSISSVWMNTSQSSGYSVTRLNTTYNASTVQVDDISLVHWGGKGVAFWPPESRSTTYEPGNEQVWFKGKVLFGPYDSVTGNVVPVRTVELRDTQPTMLVSGRTTSDADLGYVEFRNRSSTGDARAFFAGWRDGSNEQVGMRWYSFTGGASRKVGEARHTGLLQWWNGTALADVVVGSTAKTTAGAPYTNDGYIEVQIAGATIRLMTVAT